MDDERFVDLKNMLQRRIDDPMKRRNVQRLEIAAPVVKAMSEMVLLLVGKWSDATTETVPSWTVRADP